MAASVNARKKVMGVPIEVCISLPPFSGSEFETELCHCAGPESKGASHLILVSGELALGTWQQDEH